MLDSRPRGLEVQILRGVLREELQRAKSAIPSFKKAIKDVAKEGRARYKQEIYRLSIEIFKIEIRLLKRILSQKEFAEAQKISRKMERLKSKAWPEN